MKQIFILALIALNSYQAMSQDPADPKDVSHLRQSGQMFSVTIIPGAKESSFYILGKEAAKLKMNKLKIEASLFVGSNEKKLVLQRKDDHFVTATPLKGDVLQLKLSNEKPEKMEELRINLKP